MVSPIFAGERVARPYRMRARSLVTMVLVLAALEGSAQLTYVGLGVGYDRTKFDGSGSKRIVQNLSALTVSVLHRPWRFLALGASFELPYTQRLTGKYWRTSTSDGGSFSMDYWSTGFGPAINSSKVERSGAVRGLLRLFADGGVNAYVEASITSYLMKEQARLFREESVVEVYDGENFIYETVQAVDIVIDRETRINAFGLRFGVMPHFGKGLYADINMGWSLPRFSNDRTAAFFNYEYDGLDHRMNYLFLSNALAGSKTTFSAQAAMGVCF